MQAPSTLRSLDVVIPSYNSEQTIKSCLSALLQAIDHCFYNLELESVEIYVVDDGSTDQSTKIIEDFSRTTRTPIHLIRQAQQGPSAARNVGSQAGSAPWILYMDSDVEVHTQSISKLLQRRNGNEQLLAFNGHPDPTVLQGQWVSQYTNLSLCFQLQQHGHHVNTAFTSLCLMSRESWSLMNGWDTSRTSRYSDDIQSRWSMPSNSIEQCFDATFYHHKHVSLSGLMKHRFNLGLHYVSSLPTQTDVKSKRTLHLRYPMNVIAAFLSVCTTLLSLFIPHMLWLHGIWIGIVLVINTPLAKFIQSNKQSIVGFRIQIWHLLSIFGLSYLEGLSMGFGLLASLGQQILSCTSLSKQDS